MTTMTKAAIKQQERSDMRMAVGAFVFLHGLVATLVGLLFISLRG